MKYHNSPNGPRKCEARKDGGARCPYAKAGMPHFATQEEAQAAYDATMQQQFGAFETMKITRGEKLRQASYRTEDAIIAKVEKVQATVEQAKAAVVMSALNAKHKATMLRDNVSGKGKSLISKIGAKIQKVKADSIQFAKDLEAMDLANREHLRQEKANRIMARSEKLYNKAEAIANGTYVSPLKARSRDLATKAKKETVAAAMRTVQATRQVASNGARRLGEIEIKRSKMASELKRGDRITNGTVLASTVDENGVAKVRYMNKQGVVLTAKFQDTKVSTLRTVKSYSNKIKSSVKAAPNTVKQGVLAYTDAIRNNYRSRVAPFKAGLSAYKESRGIAPSVSIATPSAASDVNKVLTLAEMRKYSEMYKSEPANDLSTRVNQRSRVSEKVFA